ncbi:MAG TPA: ATP-binding cassette domain-containing protein [Methanoregula sp.]|nr:ATP-binding cassette domain-containing protein [Methanoregula sp.]
MLEMTVTRKLRDFTLDIHLTARPGKVLVLMGENGAGKSTTLNIVAGLLAPDTGSIVMNGEKIFDSQKRIDLPPEDRKMGYVFQNSAAFPHLTVRDNIAFGLRSQRVPASVAAGLVDLWMERLEIKDLARVKAGGLSGGQKQRVALARAFAPGPALLMLDEPFTALDANSIRDVKELIRTYVAERQIPCIIVTHSSADSRDVGDTACVLCRGKTEWEGNASKVPGCMCPHTLPGSGCR